MKLTDLEKIMKRLGSPRGVEPSFGSPAPPDRLLTADAILENSRRT